MHDLDKNCHFFQKYFADNNISVRHSRDCDFEPHLRIAKRKNGKKMKKAKKIEKTKKNLDVGVAKTLADTHLCTFLECLLVPVDLAGCKFRDKVKSGFNACDVLGLEVACRYCL